MDARLEDFVARPKEAGGDRRPRPSVLPLRLCALRQPGLDSRMSVGGDPPSADPPDTLADKEEPFGITSVFEQVC